MTFSNRRRNSCRSLINVLVSQDSSGTIAHSCSQTQAKLEGPQSFISPEVPPCPAPCFCPALSGLQVSALGPQETLFQVQFCFRLRISTNSQYYDQFSGLVIDHFRKLSGNIIEVSAFSQSDERK